MILAAGAYEWLGTISALVNFVAGDHDPVVDRRLLCRLRDEHPAVSVQIWPGRHDLPLIQADRCAGTIAEALPR